MPHSSTLAGPHCCASAFALATSALVTSSASAQSQVFRFDADTTGWNVYSIHYLGQPLDNPQSGIPVPFDGLVGLPPGSARLGDLTSETWLGATAAVQGNKSALFGVASVSYDIYFRFADNETYAAVALHGGGLTLYEAMPPPALETWLHWDFPLVSGSWRVNSISGPLATDEEIQAVLADFKGCFIHTEWKSGPDDTNVDNIVIGFSDACAGDLDGDGTVGASDLAILLGAWATSGPADLDGSGAVDAADLALLLGAWGPC